MTILTPRERAEYIEKVSRMGISQARAFWQGDTFRDENGSEF